MVIATKDRGITGALKLFRRMLKDAGLKEGEKIIFMGCVGKCLPFAELLGYAIRDMKLEMGFAPDADVQNVIEMKMVEGLGVQTGGKMDPKGAKVVVVLGGLAMPTSKVTPSDIIREMTGILVEDGEVVGFCFNNIFKKAGWEEKIPFNYIIDVQAGSVVLYRF